jgi:hypothetical protein
VPAIRRTAVGEAVGGEEEQPAATKQAPVNIERTSASRRFSLGIEMTPFDNRIGALASITGGWSWSHHFSRPS